MSKFYIESKAGVIMGIYDGASAEEAVAALNADSGGESVADDWIIIEVVDVDQGLGHEALYTLENGAVVVESRQYCYDYYRDMSAARDALSV